MRFSHRSRLELTVCDAERHNDEVGTPTLTAMRLVSRKANDEKNAELAFCKTLAKPAKQLGQCT